MGDEHQQQKQQSGSPDDLLESLLVSAAERAAKREAQEALEKGFVTRKDINLALDTFGAELEKRIAESVVVQVKEALMPQIEEVVVRTAGPGLRKGTVQTPEEEFEADPVAFILKKGRTDGADAYSDEEKRFIWQLTHTALIQGMEFDNRSNE